MPINSFDHYPLSWKPDLSRLSRPYYLSLARDLEEKSLPVNCRKAPGSRRSVNWLIIWI